MHDTPQPKFLLRFDGVIWNILASDEILLIEVRDSLAKSVRFSAFDYQTEAFLWKDRMLEESWWINASVVAGDKVVFTVYMDTNNPDKKGIVVYSIRDLKLIWWNNDFSLSETGIRHLKGFSSRLGLKEVVVDLNTGENSDPAGFDRASAPSTLQKPVHYVEGSEYFETVRRFLADRLNFSAVSALEYLETVDRVIISCYCSDDNGLANYLFVLSAEGKTLLKEKLDGGLKGIGMDTFFILGGCVIFVRNRVELVSYKLL